MFETHEQHVWMRGETPPAPFRYDEETGIHHLYGYDDALSVMMDPVTFSSNSQRLIPNSFEFSKELTDGNMVRLDPPEHTQLRGIVNRGFTPRMIDGLEGRVAALTHELLDLGEDGDRMELVSALAYPLPVIVIAEMLGVPGSDRVWFTSLMTKHLNSDKDALEDVAAAVAQRVDDIKQLRAYLLEHTTERRRTPREDLLTALVVAEVDGQRLTDAQVVNFANLLLIAGHVTTASMLANTVLALDLNPVQAKRIREDRSLVPGAIEESLRMYPPFQRIIRATMTDTVLSGHEIPADRLVSVWVGAANREERVFADPHEFDPTRDYKLHLSWGHGVHFCLGTPLSRLEGRVVQNILFDRYPDLRTDPQRPPVSQPSPDFTGLQSLPLLLR
ncbi:cytochrome P450 [Amycolatopsis sp. PS_44_ISF1]|uniref:cytochrome P450 n=1 Tax=Amycolatopsis sp. PS_44_ISF1 TaxID=2974917 RepID=UPI0028DE1875|nr:cytochrome P450 [Amycolatopsis sp. PS_44_ISF1]MDT8909763.1 cytochrome P450 [Amycolatopsis sp. PS_44_ISF1]